MNTLLVLGHMGLGDHLICNGMINILSKFYNVSLISKIIYKETLTRIHANNINIISVNDDNEAIKYYLQYKNYYDNTLCLGNFGNNFMKDCVYFDESFYKQSQIEYEERWKSFNICYNDETQIDEKEYIFVHDDESRSLNIKQNLINTNFKVIKPEKNQNFLNYINIIKNAKEIHAIDSSFALLADHLETKAEKMYIHRYSRPNVLYPNYNKKWEIIND